MVTSQFLAEKQQQMLSYSPRPQTSPSRGGQKYTTEKCSVCYAVKSLSKATSDFPPVPNLLWIGKIKIKEERNFSCKITISIYLFIYYSSTASHLLKTCSAVWCQLRTGKDMWAFSMWDGSISLHKEECKPHKNQWRGFYHYEWALDQDFGQWGCESEITPWYTVLSCCLLSFFWCCMQLVCMWLYRPGRERRLLPQNLSVAVRITWTQERDSESMGTDSFSAKSRETRGREAWPWKWQRRS